MCVTGQNNVKRGLNRLLFLCFIPTSVRFIQLRYAAVFAVRSLPSHQHLAPAPFFFLINLVAYFNHLITFYGYVLVRRPGLNLTLNFMQPAGYPGAAMPHCTAPRVLRFGTPET